jgi:GTP cyclohydrolase I
MPSQAVLESAIRQLLHGLDIALDDPNFVDTPTRVARLFIEMLSPQPNSWATFPARSSDLVILRGHRVTLLCPHHLMPATLTCFVGYIPNKLTVGLSKLARAIEQHLTRPLMQEDFANLIADSLEQKLEPKGVGVVLIGRHGCMQFRGVESDADVATSVMRGALLLNASARSEFMQLIAKGLTV